MRCFDFADARQVLVELALVGLAERLARGSWCLPATKSSMLWLYSVALGPRLVASFGSVPPKSRSNTAFGSHLLGVRRRSRPARRGWPNRHTSSPSRSCPPAGPARCPVRATGSGSCRRCASATCWSADMPTRMSAPCVLRGWRPVRNADMARAWSPGPSPLALALSRASPSSTFRCRLVGFERLEDVGQFAELAFLLRVPIRHDARRWARTGTRDARAGAPAGACAATGPAADAIDSSHGRATRVPSL